ncbi:hypothetical protein A8L45_12040 [Veronia pacifica]|uniref:Uncharacterized protein n=1 Tax=Veronia pacifica TaxID=1080227 RepID=A0A1C3EIF4_9GAMM|nr:hypothetical protein A8L45_12040 [Veronia pacifica]
MFFRSLIWVFAYIKRDTTLREWQAIKVADHLRVIGLPKPALKIAKSVFYSSENRRNKFWSCHLTATSLQYLSRYCESDDFFEQALEIADELERSFALQHHGKSLVEQGKKNLAKRKLKEALEIRTRLRHAELVHSTQLALIHL